MVAALFGANAARADVDLLTQANVRVEGAFELGLGGALPSSQLWPQTSSALHVALQRLHRH